jgi:hypothetical protein
MNFIYKINPKLDLKILFKLKTGYNLNLDKPTTYNEKLQWIKLYDNNPLIPQCADKYAVRKYIMDCDCGEILNDLLWHGFNAEDIPFDELPQQFVIKVTHGSGFNIICKNKDKINREKTIRKLNSWLKSKFIPCYGEWFYGVVKPRIIVEKYLNEEGFEVPIDYKVFCFNGEPKIIDVHTGRYNEHIRNLYDLEWNIIKDTSIGYQSKNSMVIEKPEQLSRLLEYSRKLSSNFIHSRVDFYIVNKKIYFGEITFTNGAGFSKIVPHSFDQKMGSWMSLPNKR